MKKRKRITSTLLALSLMLSIWSPTRALAEEGVTLSMSQSETADEADVRVGDTVTVTIEADKNFASRGSGMTIYYDDDFLEPDVSASSAADPFIISGPLTVNGKAALRISFLPGLDAAHISASEPLAELNFKALAVTEQTRITMGAAYLYDSELKEIALTKPEAVNIAIAPAKEYIPVTGITLDISALTLEEGEMASLKATILPIGASVPDVIWTSSDEKVVKVSDGIIKAISEGQATITATTEEGGFTASCFVTVAPPDAGYIVTVPAEVTAVIEDTIQIPVAISNEDEQTGYNAYDITFTYDPTILEYIATDLPGVTVTASTGKINLLDYGEGKNAGSIPFTLEFKVLQMENTNVSIIAARVDNSGNATVRNASLATLTVAGTAVNVTGYPVILPEGFDGAETAAPNEDYTFKVPDDYFEYTVKVTVGGREITLTENDDGSYTIPAQWVTDEIVITADKTGKIFRVTPGADMHGETTAQHSVDYVATIKKDEAYRYTVTVTIGGVDYTGYAIAGDTYIIPGGDIIGDIVFNIVKEEIIKPQDPNPEQPDQPAPEQPGLQQPDQSVPEQPVTMHLITITGTGAGAAQGNEVAVAHGSTYTFNLKKEAGYIYEVSYIMGGSPMGTIMPDENGTYTIENVTAPLEIVIEKILDVQISVREYVTLNEKKVYLILADALLESGKTFSYDGSVMYYSESYGAWAYLVITDKELDGGSVQNLVKITAQPGIKHVSAHGDVDQNGAVDWNDVQLVLDLYNAKYDTFDAINMKKFLHADVNADGKLDVRDAVAAVKIILER